MMEWFRSKVARLPREETPPERLDQVQRELDGEKERLTRLERRVELIEVRQEYQQQHHDDT